MKAKNAPLKIRLEHNGRTVHDMTSGDLTGEVTIGRSHSCVWPVPPEDKVASGQHACLYKKGDQLWIKDLGSTNGTYYKGKQIKKQKLQAGDRVGIGDCTLTVDVDDKHVLELPPSYIIVQTGKTRGQKKMLTPPKFTIGSDPGSSLVLLDILVSRHHAEINIREDGSCWIKDLGSKNGTSVNGVPLREDQERLLKDGDKISIAYLEMLFTAGTSRKTSSQAWIRLAIIILTGIVVVGAYETYKTLKPPANLFIDEARRLATEERFDDAARVVDMAVSARNADAHQLQIEELRRNLTVWKSTLDLWTKARGELADGQWVAAARDLGMLQSAKKESWTWNEQAMQLKTEAVNAKDLLDALLRVESVLKREDMDGAAMQKEAEQVAAALGRIPSERPEYLQKLTEALVTSQARFQQVINESDQLDKALALFGTSNPPFQQILETSEQLQHSSSESLAKKASQLYGPIRALVQAYGAFDRILELATDMQFQAALETRLEIPSADLCAQNPNLSKARKNLEVSYGMLREQVSQISYLYNEVQKRLGGAEGVPPALACWNDAAVMDKVFAVDSLAMHYPKRSRITPSGEYDRLLGIEEFYAVLSAIPNQPDLSVTQDLGFVPQLTQARELLSRFTRLQKYLDEPDKKWLLRGRLAERLRELAVMLPARDVVVQAMLDKAAAAKGRVALIAAGIAYRLAADPAALALQDRKLDQWIAQEIKAQKDAGIKLNNEYNFAAPQRQIEIRDQVLKLGLPGDPTVKRMWIFRDAALSQ